MHCMYNVVVVIVVIEIIKFQFNSNSIQYALNSILTSSVWFTRSSPPKYSNVYLNACLPTQGKKKLSMHNVHVFFMRVTYLISLLQVYVWETIY